MDHFFRSSSGIDDCRVGAGPRQAARRFSSFPGVKPDAQRATGRTTQFASLPGSAGSSPHKRCPRSPQRIQFPHDARNSPGTGRHRRESPRSPQHRNAPTPAPHLPRAAAPPFSIDECGLSGDKWDEICNTPPQHPHWRSSHENSPVRPRNCGQSADRQSADGLLRGGPRPRRSLPPHTLWCSPKRFKRADLCTILKGRDRYGTC